MNAKRGLLTGLALACIVAAAGLAHAQDAYPTRPIRLIVGFPAGSSGDISARVLANRMSQTLGQQIVVEPKPGAGSALAAEFVARAPNDGYTLFYMSSANVTDGAINTGARLNVEKDFTPVALTCLVAIVLAAPPAAGVGSVAELAALAQSSPGRVLYASTGIGSSAHLSGELFAMRTGARLVHVPYAGSPQAVTDLVAGRVTMMFSSVSTIIPQANAGKLTILAAATTKRLSFLPAVPTMGDAGMPDFDTSIWFGIVAPAGAPQAVVAKLAAATREAVRAEDVASALRPQGIEPFEGGPDDFARHISAERLRWEKVAAAAGLRN